MDATGPAAWRRIQIVGVSGSGKTTVARALAEKLGLSHIELDALHHGPDWTEAPDDVFRARVEAAMAAAPAGWIIDGSYWRKLGDLVLASADTLIWIDLPFHLAMARLWRRTWGRILRNEVLWNGNRESVRGAFLMKDSLFAYTLKHRARLREELPGRLARHPHIRILRLRSPRQVARLLA